MNSSLVPSRNGMKFVSLLRSKATLQNRRPQYTETCAQNFIHYKDNYTENTTILGFSVTEFFQWLTENSYVDPWEELSPGCTRSHVTNSCISFHQDRIRWISGHRKGRKKLFVWHGIRFKGTARNIYRKHQTSNLKSTRRRLDKVEGWWVWCKDQIPQKHHSYEEVQAALKKDKEFGGYISAKDVLTALYIMEDDVKKELNHDNSHSESSDSDEKSDTANLMYTDLTVENTNLFQFSPKSSFRHW